MRKFVITSPELLFLFQRLVVLRFIDLDVIIAVQDQPSSQQDINSSCFNVVTPTRTYELMAHDEQEKLRCDIVLFTFGFR